MNGPASGHLHGISGVAADERLPTEFSNHVASLSVPQNQTPVQRTTHNKLKKREEKNKFNSWHTFTNLIEYQDQHLAFYEIDPWNQFHKINKEKLREN